MIVIVVSYFVSFAITIVLLSRKKIKAYSFPSLRVGKDGVSFYSWKRHKIKIGSRKLMQVEKVVYVKTTNQMIVIKMRGLPAFHLSN